MIQISIGTLLLAGLIVGEAWLLVGHFTALVNAGGELMGAGLLLALLPVMLIQDGYRKILGLPTKRANL